MCSRHAAAPPQTQNTHTTHIVCVERCPRLPSFATAKCTHIGHRATMGHQSVCDRVGVCSVRAHTHTDLIQLCGAEHTLHTHTHFPGAHTCSFGVVSRVRAHSLAVSWSHAETHVHTPHTARLPTVDIVRQSSCAVRPFFSTYIMKQLIPTPQYRCVQVSV